MLWTDKMVWAQGQGTQGPNMFQTTGWGRTTVSTMERIMKDLCGAMKDGHTYSKGQNHCRLRKNAKFGEITRKEALTKNTFLTLKIDISWCNWPRRNEGILKRYMFLHMDVKLLKQWTPMGIFPILKIVWGYRGLLDLFAPLPHGVTLNKCPFSAFYCCFGCFH